MTKRCNIRKAELQDSEFLLKLFSIPDVIKNIDGMKHFSSEISSVNRVIANLNSAEDSQGRIWIIEIDLHKIGFAMVYDLFENPFISYALLPEYRGNGYMLECVLAIGKSIFNLIHSKISINVDVDNLSAIRLKGRVLNSSIGEKIFY